MLIAILIVYFIFLFIFTFYFHQRSKNKRDFFIAGGRLGLWPVAGSLSATGIGSSATIVASAYIYQYGLAGIWFNTSAGIFLILMGLFLAKKIYQSGALSLPELIGNSYGEINRKLSAILVFCAEIAWLSLTIQATQIVLSAFGIDTNTPFALSAITLFFIAYTIWGGQFAVAFSDLFQAFWFFLAFGVFGIFYLFPANTQSLPIHFWQFPVNETLPANKVIALILLIGLPHLVGSDIYARIFSAKNSHIARQASLIAGGLRILWGLIIAAIVVGGYGLMNALDKPTQFLPHLISNHFPSVLAGFALAALLAIFMSSADSILLTASTVMVNDILKEKIAPKYEILTARIIILFMGSLALGLSLHLQSLIKTLELGYSLFAASFTLPVIMALYQKDLSPYYAISSMLLASSGTILCQFFPQWHEKSPIAAWDPVFIGLMLSSIVTIFFIIKKNLNPRLQ